MRRKREDRSLDEQPIFPRNIFHPEPPDVQFEKYLKRRFELSKEPIIDLYCGIMFNPDMYIEHLFLSLAFAIDSYHKILFEKRVKLRDNMKRKSKE